MYVNDFMLRAVALAQRGEGHANPNPLVGCVMVSQGKVIGEGWHACYGHLHAERAAVQDCLAKGHSCQGAEVYVTLEPCSHHGKQPPCADLLIEQRVGKVYVGMEDPNPLVAGRGISRLRAAGIEVSVGYEQEAIAKQNRPFLTLMTQRRPYVLMKWAQTLDGKIATYTGDSRWVSGKAARQYAHALRHRLMGIMVGIGTALADDPLLNCRLEGEANPSHPIRIVVDSRCRLPLESQLARSAKEYPLVVAHTKEAPAGNVEALQMMGAHTLLCRSYEDEVDLKDLLSRLASSENSLGRPIDSIQVEGGARLNAAMLRTGWVDELNVIVASKIVGSHNAPGPVADMGIAQMAHALELEVTEVKRLGKDWVMKIEGSR